MKTLTQDYQAALESGSLKLAVLVEIDHPAGFVRVWSGIGSLVWNGNTYAGRAALGRIEGIGATAEIRTTETRYSFIAPALDADAMAIVMQSPRGRSVRTWLALLDDDWAIIPDPVLVDDSVIENIESSHGADGTVILSLPATSAIYDFHRASSIAITHEQQQKDYPGDTGYRLKSSLADLELQWTNT